eukprot:998441-Pelagomonas_calceolata.AAC.1
MPCKFILTVLRCVWLSGPYSEASMSPTSSCKANQVKEVHVGIAVSCATTSLKHSHSLADYMQNLFAHSGAEPFFCWFTKLLAAGRSLCMQRAAQLQARALTCSASVGVQACRAMRCVLSTVMLDGYLNGAY